MEGVCDVGVRSVDGEEEGGASGGSGGDEMGSGPSPARPVAREDLCQSREVGHQRLLQLLTQRSLRHRVWRFHCDDHGRVRGRLRPRRHAGHLVAILLGAGDLEGGEGGGWDVRWVDGGGGGRLGWGLEGGGVSGEGVEWRGRGLERAG